MEKYTSENSELVARAIGYIRENKCNPEITVGDVARGAGFSENYFNRVFALHTGFSVMEYVRHERLRAAAEALRGDGDILKIALDAGYGSHEGFIRAFRAQYGCTPGEYREQKRGKAGYWGEQVDATLIGRFIHDHPEFRHIDEDDLIDTLLGTDAKRYGYLCTSIVMMGLRAVTDMDDPMAGFILIGDTREGTEYLTLVTDDTQTLGRWMRLSHVTTVYSEGGVSDIPELRSATVVPETMYFGEPYRNALPEGISIEKLTIANHDKIREWVGDRHDGYSRHLLNLGKVADDPTVLEFGVFEDGRMTAAVGCGIDAAHGFRLNNSAVIRFAPGAEREELYRPVFMGVTDMLLGMGLVPFDDIQNGEYALRHGGFTSEEMGYIRTATRYGL